jgi:Tat protein translocase TatB subunit
MFNIGPMELIVILLVALIVVGPKRLPEVGRSIGKSLRELRRASDEVRYSFETSLDDEPAEVSQHAKSSQEKESSPNGSQPKGRPPQVPDEA